MSTNDSFDHLVVVCTDDDCRDRGAKDVRKEILRAAKKLDVIKRCRILDGRCFGNCDKGPFVVMSPGGVWMDEATPKQARKAFEKVVADAS